MNKNKRHKENKTNLIQNFVNQIQGTLHKKGKTEESQTKDKKAANKRQGTASKNNLH